MFATAALAQNFPVTDDPGYNPKTDWVPSFAFPRTPPSASDAKPWAAIDPTKNPGDYANAVLNYFFEGQDTKTWRVQDNPVRKWYHMPWMHFGPLGREKFHGLTRERNAPPPTLAENGQTQTQCPQTWSIGFFNPTAAYQLWKIWNDGSSAPDFSAAATAEGSVVVKLLFSQADPSQMPYLKGSPSQKANTTKQTGAPTDCVKLDVMDRTPTTVRLVQVDFAVKDPTHAPKTNWVFGTFAYRNEAPGADPWKKLVPVGVTWGNDPDLSDDMPPNPRESIVLNKFGFTRVFGRNGRMNGPLDNVTASCMACHQTAQKPNTAGLAPADNDKWDVAKCWFRDLSTEAFGNKPSATSCGDTTGFQSLDFSLQLQVGWRNWTNPDAHKKMTASKTMATPKGAAVKSMQPMTIDNKVSLPITR